MSDVLFDREIRVEVFTEAGTRITLGPAPGPDLEPLHISFEVNLRTRGEPNDSTIRLYNLAPPTLNLLRNDGAGVRLFAGYAGKADKIYEGTIIVPTTNPDGAVDTVTEIISSDGYRNLDRSYFSKSYSAGTLVFTVLKDVAESLGLPYEINPETFATSALLRGRSFDNKARRVLQEVTGDYDLSWKIDYGVLKVGPRDRVDRTSPTAVLLNSETGFIGTPTVKFERYQTETRRRIVARSLLNTGLRPGRMVQVESSRFIVEVDKKFKRSNDEIVPDGVYLIDEATFTGDNFGGDFDVEVTGYGNK